MFQVFLHKKKKTKRLILRIGKMCTILNPPTPACPPIERPCARGGAGGGWVGCADSWKNRFIYRL